MSASGCALSWNAQRIGVSCDNDSGEIGELFEKFVCCLTFCFERSIFSTTGDFLSEDQEFEGDKKTGAKIPMLARRVTWRDPAANSSSVSR